jgi:hypothetical protein
VGDEPETPVGKLAVLVATLLPDVVVVVEALLEAEPLLHPEITINAAIVKNFIYMFITISPMKLFSKTSENSLPMKIRIQFLAYSFRSSNWHATTMDTEIQ